MRAINAISCWGAHPLSETTHCAPMLATLAALPIAPVAIASHRRDPVAIRAVGPYGVGGCIGSAWQRTCAAHIVNAHLSPIHFNLHNGSARQLSSLTGEVIIACILVNSKLQPRYVSRSRIGSGAVGNPPPTAVNTVKSEQTDRSDHQWKGILTCPKDQY